MNYSPKQTEALEMLLKKGKLVRHAGGFWTYEGCERIAAYEGQTEIKCWLWWVGTRTIQALKNAGKLIEPRRGEVRLRYPYDRA